jgi:hypothetical protein
MSDEFDDVEDAAVLKRGIPAWQGAAGRAGPAARLVLRLYAANAPLRARMLACLVRPLSPLGLVAIAAGAFAGLLQRPGSVASWAVVDDVGRYSKDQIYELARFVEQVSPDALQQVADLIASRPVGIAAFSASAAMLLLRAVQRQPSLQSVKTPEARRSRQ